MNPKQQILATLLKRTGLFTDAQVEILLAANLTDGLAAAVTRLEMAKESDFLERPVRAHLPARGAVYKNNHQYLPSMLTIFSLPHAFKNEASLGPLSLPIRA